MGFRQLCLRVSFWRVSWPATMSTADSQLLAASSSVSQNLFAEFFGVKFTAKQGMLVARGTMVVISLVAMFLARDPNSSVFRVVSFAWAGFGAAFGPVVLFALFWRRSNQWGALAGMLAGGAMVFIWKYLIAPMGGAWAIMRIAACLHCGIHRHRRGQPVNGSARAVCNGDL